jgi:hypothetical protein
MIDADLEAIEGYLEFPLPPRYRELMRNYPFDRNEPNLRIV